MDRTITLMKDDGTEVIADILFTYHHDDFGKDYVVFQVRATGEISAASYTSTDETTGSLDRIENDEAKYIAVIPYYESVDEILDDDGEVIVLRVVEEDGETFLEAIQDDEEFGNISAIFEERLSDYLYEDDSEE